MSWSIEAWRRPFLHSSGIWHIPNLAPRIAPATAAFVYAASPLGFTLLGQRFAFMNTNSSINQLLASNSRSGKIVTEAEKKEAERYTQWFARMLKQLMDCKVEQLNNIQVILKGTDEKDKYIFSVISNEALQTFNDEKVRKALEYLGEYPYTRIGADYPLLPIKQFHFGLLLPISSCVAVHCYPP